MAAELPEHGARYRFGPLERRGVLLGLRGGQVGVLAETGLVFVAIAMSHPDLRGMTAGLLVVAAGVIVAFAPVGGQTLEQRAPVTARFVAQRLTGGHRYRSPTPQRGFRPDGSVAKPLVLPGPLSGLQIIQAPAGPGGRGIGVIKDVKAQAYIGLLAAEGRTFSLLEGWEQERRLAGWGAVLAGLARDASPISRIQWIDRTVPDDGDALGRYLAEAAVAPPQSPAVASYRKLIGRAGPVTQQHEVYLAVRVSARRARKAVAKAGGGDAGACIVLSRELRALEARLRAAQVVVTDGALSTHKLALVLRTAFSPAARRSLLDAGADAGLPPHNAWPQAVDVTRTTYRTDDAWHATYWVAEWPRLDVGANFLAPLLIQTTAARTVSVTMEPVPPLRAVRAVEAARMADVANAELRRRYGFLTKARRHREEEGVVRRAEELVDGHADYRFSGYVTVTAPDAEALEEACDEIEQSAGLARLQLQRLNELQDVAFTWTLPLCRGLE